MPGSTDAFETAVLVVLGQHVSLAAGRVFAARLVAAHGNPNTVGCSDGCPGDHLSTQPGQIRAFPGPQVLAALDPEDLRRTCRHHRSPGTHRGRDRPRGRRRHGGPDPRRAADVAEVRPALLALPGIGPWTADLVALRALRDPDVFLPGDLVLRKALGAVTARAAATASEAWRPHRSLAVLHLWTHHAIDPPR